MKKRKFFIGSSREQMGNAEKVACWLEEFNCDPVVWNDEKIFPLGSYTFDQLKKVSCEVDGAIFIFGADDKTWCRGEESLSIRDNVLLEYGLFCGQLSRERVIFLCQGEPHIASDLSGITYADLQNQYNAKNKLKSWAQQTNPNEEKLKFPINQGQFAVMGLFDAFGRVFQEGNNFEQLKIFAVSTYKSVQLLRLVPQLKIKDAKVLLRDYKNVDRYYNAEMKNTIKIAISAWERMAELSNIEELSVKFFDYHPDEGFYLLDNKYLIMGCLNYNIKAEQFDFVSDVMLVDNKTVAGKRWIEIYSERFDRMYENFR